MINLLKKIFVTNNKVSLKELVSNGAIILDVRTKEEYKSGHIKGSLNVPLINLNHHIAGMNKDTTVITCCASGIRSASAKTILKSNGFREVHNGGGWMSLNNQIKNGK